MMFKSLVAIAATLVGAQAAVQNCTMFCNEWTEAGANSGELVQSLQGCLESCELYPVGTESDMSGNTLGCRQHHFNHNINTTGHLSHGNLFGGYTTDGTEHCGSACDHYCTALTTQCTGSDFPYMSEAQCYLACGYFPIIGLDGGVSGELSGNTSVNPLPRAGNSLECRTHHAQVGELVEGGCGRAAGSSLDDTCGTACMHFCDAVMDTCTGENEQYPDFATCVETCAFFGDEPGFPLQESGNSVQCRTYHTYHAAHDSGAMAHHHCHHAGLHPEDDTCGSACDVYCDIVQSHCQGDLALYADNNECHAACAEFPVTDETPLATSGNSLECRIYHAGAAGGDAASHCHHARLESDTCFDEPAVVTSGVAHVQFAKATIAVVALVAMFL